MFPRSTLRWAACGVVCLLSLFAPSRGQGEEWRAPAVPLHGIEQNERPGIHWTVTAPDRTSGQDSQLGIPVAAFEIEGNRVFADAELADVLAPFTGRSVAPSELHQVVDTLLKHYSDHGYFAAHVSLPPQRIEDGVVRLVVSEGALRNSRLALSGPVPKPASAPVTRRSSTGQRVAAVEPSSLRFFDASPASRARASLVGSERRPAERVVVELDEGPFADFGGEAGLFAAPGSDDWRAGASVQLVNPAGYGSNVVARGITADGSQPYLYGRVDAPLDVGGSKLASPGGYLDETLAEELMSDEVDGETMNLELATEKPLLRLPDFSLAVRAKAQHFSRHDEARGTTTARRVVDAAHLTTRARLSDNLLGGGTTAGSLTWTLGHTDLNGFEPHARADAAGDRTAGTFGRVRASLARQQSLPGPWSLYGALTAQGSSQNLDGSQRFAIGGLPASRGFAVGEAVGDEGFRLNADLRYAFPEDFLGGRLNMALFYDHGELRLRQDPRGGSNNTARHSSIGLSFRQSWSDDTFVHVSAGRQIDSTLAASQNSDSKYRFWVKVGLDF